MLSSHYFDLKKQLDSFLLSFFLPFLKRFSQDQIDASLVELKDKNEYLNNLEILAGEAKLNSFPPHLEIEFTNACNLRCFMCFHSSQKIKYVQMEETTVAGLIGRLPFVKTILIAGIGEQLLFKNLSVFLKLAKKYLCRVHLITNGQLIDKQLEVFGLLSGLTVSFDGSTKDVFEVQRTSSRFNRILANIKLLRTTYPDLKITLGCVVSRLNLNQLSGIMEIAGNLGVRAVSFTPVQHAPMIALRKNDSKMLKKQIKKCREIALLNDTYLICSDIENIKLLEETTSSTGNLLDKVVAESKKRIETIPKDSVGLQKALTSAKINKISEQLDDKKICKAVAKFDLHIQDIEAKFKVRSTGAITLPYCLAPWNYGFVKMNGNFRLCCYLNFEEGNINEYSKGVDFVNVRKSLVSRQGMLRDCKSCPDSFHQNYNIESLTKACDKLGVTIKAKV